MMCILDLVVTWFPPPDQFTVRVIMGTLSMVRAE